MGPARFGSYVLSLVLLLPAAPTFAQQTTPTPTSDPQAVALVTKALAALTGGRPITDVTLTGTATRTAGSDVETGAITLKALGPFDSRIDFAGSGGNLAEIRNSLEGLPQGAWIGTDGVSHAMVGHNCMTDAVWFFPALSILTQVANPNVVASYVGLETRNGASLQHVRFVAVNANMSGATATLLSALSREDVYLDATSLLPIVISFNTHSDDDALTNIAIEIDFSDYQNVSGSLIPFKTQRLVNNGIFLELSIESAALNSGLSDSTFAIH